MHSVVYKKEFSMFRKEDFGIKNCILLSLEFKEAWSEMLKDKVINEEEIYGISTDELIKHGAVIGKPIPDFTVREMFVFMSVQLRNGDMGAMEVIDTFLPNRKGNFVTLKKLKRQISETTHKIEKEWKNV